MALSQFGAARPSGHGLGQPLRLMLLMHSIIARTNESALAASANPAPIEYKTESTGSEFPRHGGKNKRKKMSKSHRKQVQAKSFGRNKRKK